MALDTKNNQLEAWSYIKRAYKIDPNDNAIESLYGTLKLVKDKNNKEREEKLNKNKPETGKTKQNETREDTNEDKTVKKAALSEKAK